MVDAARKIEDASMIRFVAALIAGVFTVFISASNTNATPACLRDIKPYKLAGDTIEWSMKIAPGTDCIQGLRWSTMQIYNVAVLEKPKSGDIKLVGPGFRYFAKLDFAETDKFTLVVSGKNRRDLGESIVQVTVLRSNTAVLAAATQSPE